MPLPDEIVPPLNRVAVLTDCLRGLLSGSYPDEAARVTLSFDRFLTAALRFVEGVHFLGQQVEPTWKKMGMGLSSLTLRSRELAGHFRQFDAAWSGLSLPSTEAPREIGAAYRAGLHRLDGLLVPQWPIEQDYWLMDHCHRVSRACLATWEIASLLETLPPERKNTAIIDKALAEFRSAGMPYLTGTDGLLTCLPEISKEVSGRIYREEYLDGS